MASWLASDTDALQLDARFDALGPATAGRPPFCIRVIRAIRGEFYFGAEFTAAFDRRVFGKRGWLATDPRSGRSLKAPA